MTEVTASYTILTYPYSELPKQYEAMIYSKWLRSLRFGNEMFKLIDSDAYYKNYHKFLEVLLSRNATIRLAVLTSDYDVVLGFSAYRDFILDYVHVHKDNRRIGIATSLIPASIEVITHLTKMFIPIWESKYSHWIFNPFI
jgi:hypothetical protein